MGTALAEAVAGEDLPRLIRRYVETLEQEAENFRAAREFARGGAPELRPREADRQVLDVAWLREVWRSLEVAHRLSPDTVPGLGYSKLRDEPHDRGIFWGDAWQAVGTARRSRQGRGTRG